MQVTVLVERLDEQTYRAETAQPVALVTEGRTRDEAIERLRVLAQQRLIAGKWCVWTFLRWLLPIRGYHSQESGKTSLISTLCWNTLLRHAVIWMRRSPRHEPLGP